MELVPEEKLVAITTEKPILSPRNENVEVPSGFGKYLK